MLSELRSLYLKFWSKQYNKKFVLHLIVAPQLSSGWRHNYSTKTRQEGRANEQSMYSLMPMNSFQTYFVSFPGRRTRTDPDVVPDAPVLHAELGRMEKAAKRPRQHHDRPEPDRARHPDVHPGLHPDPERGGRGGGGRGRPVASRRRFRERAGMKRS